MPFWTVTAFSVLGLFAGANLAYQAVLNTQLRSLYLGTPLRASLVSYIGGLACCVLALLVTRQSLNVADPAFRTHWWLWTGGIFGVIYVALVIWLIPRLGSGTVFSLVVAGQLIAAVLFDAIGLFGIPTRAADPGKLLGIVLVIAGAVLIRR